MLKNRLKKILDSKPCTLLGVGPMSKNCVDVSIDIANKFEFPIMLIASRRQIDSDEFGGGYVNNWDTKSFASYVRNKDKKGYIMLARDHGGPWQNNLEVSKKLSLKDAMESAKRSYAEDIESGFEIIHIDPSIDIHSKPTTDQILDRVYELYDFCMKYAEKLNREILIEIGTEEQSGTTNTQEELEHTLISIKRFCDKNKFTQPTFVVIQTGTRVMEMQNIGTFDNPLRIKNEIPAEIQIPKMIDICNKHDIYMKEHNTDYLSNDSLRVHPRLGIHASNVAPEFGVEETKCFMKLLQKWFK
jgi:tagatose-1,6-bisphosphate aldolase non-catalytic subunit AgaZ/GatZ